MKKEIGSDPTIVGGARKPRSQMPASLFQLMNWLEVVAYIKDTSTLSRIKEARPVLHYQSIPFDVQRRSIGLFMTEVFQKTVKEHEANQPLYDFLQQTFITLDNRDQHISNLHLVFLLHLSRFLGFYPDDRWSENDRYFDLLKGTFVPFPHPAYTMEPENSKLLSRLMELSVDQADLLKVSRKERQALIEDLLAFFKLHMDKMPDIQTHKVLANVFG